MYVHFGGFESGYLSETCGDLLGCSRSAPLWREDLIRVHNAGITNVRYAIPWHLVEKQPGQFDWTCLDGPLALMRDAGMQPVLDALDHTSIPEWLQRGLLAESFPELYARFVDRLSRRYPFVRCYSTTATPLAAIAFASHIDFVRAALNMADAICRAWHVVKSNGPARMMHVEMAEHHSAGGRRSADQVRFANARRFLLTDLILGRVTSDHELYSYLLANRADSRRLDQFCAHPVPIETLGLHYYPESEPAWRWSLNQTLSGVRAPRGFASVAEDYVLRFGLPIMLAGTSVPGSVQDRIAWLKLMESECEELALSGIDFRGFCWCPSVGTARTDTPERSIWSVHALTHDRIGSELSAYYSQLARRRISSAHLPTFPFDPDLHKRLLRGYSKTKHVA